MPTPRLSLDTLQAAVDAYMRHGGSRSAACADLGIPKSTFENQMHRAREAGLWDGRRPPPRIVQTQLAKVGGDTAQARHGWIVTPTEDGGRTSTFWKGEGGPQALEEIARGLAANLPRLPTVAAPAPDARGVSLANLYTLTDAHIGMLSWMPETGATWNMKEAQRILSKCFAGMIERAPAADIGVVAILGDWLHWDGWEAVTPQNRHILDNDTRFPKLVETGTAILRQVIDHALHKHARVVLAPVEGNHDPASAQWMRVMMTALYENEPRLEVLRNRSPFLAYQHGETMLGWHHGHTVKPGQVTGVFASEFPKIWGVTRFRHFHMGHMHHTYEKEHAGAIVFQHPTLAARDAYAARHGWKSMRRACAITYHETHGECGRVYVSPEMLA